ncbi:hypothetical protein DFQ27_000401, partial [Actinomortierella ambigua]
SLLVATSVVHAQEACDPIFDIFCTGTEHDVDRIFDEFLASFPDPANNATSSANNGTTGNPKNDAAAKPVLTPLYRRQNGCPIKSTCPGRRSKKTLFGDIQQYFKTFAANIKLIAQGKFGEGIFNQMKNAGEWCDNPNVFVKSVLEGLKIVTTGGSDAICDCVYATIKPYDNFDQFQLAALCKDVDVLAPNCPNQARLSLSKQLMGDLIPNSELVDAYKKQICSTLDKSTAGKNCP